MRKFLCVVSAPLDWQQHGLVILEQADQWAHAVDFKCRIWRENNHLYEEQCKLLRFIWHTKKYILIFDILGSPGWGKGVSFTL